MKNLIAAAGIYLLKKLDLYSLLSLRAEGYLKENGWFESFRTGLPVDAAKIPIPWMTYASIGFIDKRINKDMTVFEYSCGNSTLWWSTRVKHLISCEHDKEWYEKMKRLIPSNVELYQLDLVYSGAYCHKIAEYSRAFDIVVIDGRDRNNCAKNCLGALKEDGVVIWDNSDRESYSEGYAYLLQNGFKRLDFEGMGPVNVYSWCTSVFYKGGNCLGL